MPNCCGEVVENWALGNKFYVCRKCKQEVTEMPPTNPVGDFTFSASMRAGTPAPIAVELAEQLELFDPWVTGNLSFNNNKDDDNGQEEDQNLQSCPLEDFPFTD